MSARKPVVLWLVWRLPDKDGRNGHAYGGEWEPLQRYAWQNANALNDGEPEPKFTVVRATVDAASVPRKGRKRP